MTVVADVDAALAEAGLKNAHVREFVRYWAEVSGAVFKRYLELHKVDARDEPIAAGKLANTPTGYPTLEGHSVDIAFGTAREPPKMTLQASTHPLSLEQQRGIAITQVHEINSCSERSPHHDG